ncbi:MAG: DUF547 domain-containing protein [Saprospiraceae bacterium]|nr:DUF547 domain-containing protein [Saprospiraceae bacterium]
MTIPSPLFSLLFIIACNAPNDPPKTTVVSVSDTSRTAPTLAAENTPSTPDAVKVKPVSAIKTPAHKQRAASPKPKSTQAIPPQEPTSTALPLPSIQSTPDIPNHLRLDTLLQKYVDASGRVNYTGLKSEKAALDAYCQSLSDHPVEESWSRHEKMAYWINAYNAYTLKLIVDHYPTKSIMNFDGGKTWDVKRIRLGSRSYSLNNIENDIIRPQFKDPRIHFAVNCAAKSCPPLWNHAYTAENLDRALDERTRLFINNAKYNKLDGQSIQVSKIFEWYAADFGNLITFLNKYADSPIAPVTGIRFQEYDWNLNE